MARKGRSDAPLVYIEESSVKDLQALQKLIGQMADPAKRKRALNKRLSEAVRPIVNDQRSSAKGISFSSSGRSGTSRTKRTSGVTKTGRARKGKGLRQEMAASIRVQMRNGKYAGVIIRQNSSDPTVNKIGARLNGIGRVRHPLFGNTDHWYNTTTSNGKDWFWNPFAAKRDEIRAAIKSVLDEEIKDVARKINGLS